MRRLLAVIIAVLATVVPAHAAPVTGTIHVPVLSPQPARLAYMATASANGAVGYVFSLPTSAAGAHYTLVGSGAFPVQDLDVYFETNLTMGTPCPIGTSTSQSGNTETGTICPMTGTPAQLWAVVVIAVGGEASFTFSYV